MGAKRFSIILLTLKQLWSKFKSSMAKKKSPYVKGLENKIERLEAQLAENSLIPIM